MPPLTNRQRLTSALPSPPKPPRSPRPASRKGRLLAASGLVLGIAAVGLLVTNRQSISDWWRLRGYQPPAAVQQLASQTTMTPYARHLFYLNKPEVLSAVDSFRQHCPENEDTIVLGCYHPVENGIYIYNVKDPELQGVSQVTAAHEDLHAIYGRLSGTEKRRVNGLLEDYYQHGLTDQRVKDEIKLYQKDEPTAVLDEMHSTFGTEVAGLPPALETYYKQYFTNRAAIVNYSRQYEQAFSARQGKISQDDQQLAAMKTQIDAQQSALQAQQDQLSAAQSQLKALLAAGQTGEYNARIPAYNAQVNDYNSGVAALKSLINQYNQLVAARNAIASELTTLDKALDTRLTSRSHASH
ncbi:MAG TPA: hypothetical protein VFH99_01520 [Candidatus Saccharimonadales bacterium]|nr:hypothetical protein [Candidatus Saccharimonadales bacterium]